MFFSHINSSLPLSPSLSLSKNKQNLKKKKIILPDLFLNYLHPLPDFCLKCDLSKQSLSVPSRVFSKLSVYILISFFESILLAFISQCYFTCFQVQIGYKNKVTNLKYTQTSAMLKHFIHIT